jgi:TonB family protein
MELIDYLLKVNIAIILFYGFYRLLSQQDTLFLWKRAALLSILFVSFLYPFLDIAQSLAANQRIKEVLENSLLPSYSLPEIIVSGKTEGNVLYFPSILFAAYGAVAFLLFVRILMQMGILFYKISQTKRLELYGKTVYGSPGLRTPFSFFKWIVLDPSQYTENELKEILLHEETHVRQGHSIDTILSEAMCAFCWFNPFVWLMRREIRMNLEFLADHSVLASGCEAEHYQFHLLRLSYSKAAANLSNNFNVSLLKKRIFMMNKKQTSPVSILKYALLLPVAAALLFFNSCLNTKEKDKSVTPTEEVAEAMTPVTPTEEIVETVTPVPEKKDIFSHVETPPSFPGGEKELMKYLQENIAYPKEVADKGIEGRVIVRFVVTETGAVSSAEIVRSLDPLADKEALRVVSAMPAWIPGKQGGKAVNVYFTLPVLFKLNN